MVVCRTIQENGHCVCFLSFYQWALFYTVALNTSLWKKTPTLGVCPLFHLLSALDKLYKNNFGRIYLSGRSQSTLNIYTGEGQRIKMILLAVGVMMAMFGIVLMIYILWWVSVCLSRKIITSSWEFPVTTWTTHNHPLQLRVSFDGSRLVFHGSISVFIGFQWFRLVLMVFHGSRLDFHGSRSVFMV